MRVFLALLTLPALACAQSAFVDNLLKQELIEFGHTSFVRRCSGCHGQEGKGDGPAAWMLDPKPRNLVEGSFKFRSTPSGLLPTTEDIVRTIEQGIPGSAMPPFRDLPGREKLALAAYVRSLRSDFEEAPQVPLNLPPTPPEIFSSKEGLLSHAKTGYEAYKTNCLQCHGVRGRGDGPSAATLVDNNEQKILPANLNRVRLKSGSTAADLYRTISTGLDGTPMPGFQSVLSDAQRWDLVAFIFYLRGLEYGIYSAEESFLDPVAATPDETGTSGTEEESSDE